MKARTIPLRKFVEAKHRNPVIEKPFGPLRDLDACSARTD